MTEQIAPEKIDAFDKTGGQCILFNVRKAARVLTQIYDESLRPTGYRSTQLTLVGATLMLGPVTVNQLSDTVVMDRTTLTRNLKPLEKQNLIKVKVGVDRRERVVVVTEKGRRLMEQAYPLLEKTRQKVEQVIGCDHTGRLLQELQSLLGATKKG